jgi:hypothetical protein
MVVVVLVLVKMVLVAGVMVMVMLLLLLLPTTKMVTSKWVVIQNRRRKLTTVCRLSCVQAGDGMPAWLCFTDFSLQEVPPPRFPAAAVRSLGW